MTLSAAPIFFGHHFRGLELRPQSRSCDARYENLELAIPSSTHHRSRRIVWRSLFRTVARSRRFHAIYAAIGQSGDAAECRDVAGPVQCDAGVDACERHSGVEIVRSPDLLFIAQGSPLRDRSATPGFLHALKIQATSPLARSCRALGVSIPANGRRREYSGWRKRELGATV